VYRCQFPPLKKRINISLDKRVHEWAQAAAAREGSNLSQFLTRLIEAERKNQAGPAGVTRQDLALLRDEIARDVFRRLSERPGGG